MCSVESRTISSDPLLPVTVVLSFEVTNTSTASGACNPGPVVVTAVAAQTDAFADATSIGFAGAFATPPVLVPAASTVQDSLVICCEYADGSSFMPLFVLLAPDRELDEALTSRIFGRLKQEASPRHAPDAIYAVPAIPYTLTGKKMEVPVRKILLGADPDKVASRDTMANPAALDWYVGFADTLRRSDRPSRMSARGS